MNVYDSHRMADLMAPFGYALADDYPGADMVVLNTCHIREKASEKVFSELGRIREEKERLKASGRDMLIAVAGCVGQAEGEEIISRAPFVDIVVGPQSYHMLPELAAKSTRKNGGGVKLDFAPEEKFDSLPEHSLPQGPAAFLSVQEGCDKFCSFCVVPYTRGAEYSRPPGKILEEAARMAEQGAVEIVLLGQNVNAYHGGGWSLARLIEETALIPGIERIRYTTSHPLDMSDDLIVAHGEIEKLMPYLHLPVQSGSDKVLAEMNRRHKAEDYRKVVAKLREKRPDIALSSDFIVGFPGESDKDFEDSLRLAEEIGFAQSYSFKYSPRPGTPASIREDQIPESVKEERLAALQQTLMAGQEEFNRKTVGKTLRVLLSREGRKEGQAVGKTPYLQSVVLENAGKNIGKMASVKITEAFANSVKGELLAGNSTDNL